MKKLTEKATLCVLNREYYDAVIGTASIFVNFPYNKEYAKKAWHWKNLFWKVNGYILTGFKIDWPSQKDYSIKNKNFEQLHDWIKASNEAPIQNIFLTEDQYLLIKTLKNDGCKMFFTHEGVFKRRINSKKIKTSCLYSKNDFIEILNNKDLYKIKSIESFVAG